MKLPDEKNGRKARVGQSYGERLAARQKLDGLKGQGPPLGGAPPIPEGKLSAFLPQPGFFQPQDERMDVPPEFSAVNKPLEPPPVGGVGSAYSVNQAQARGDIGAVSMAEAGKMGYGGVVKRGQISQETAELLKHAEFKEEEPETKEQSLQKTLDDAGEEIAKDGSPAVGFDFDSLVSLRNELSSTKRRELIEERLDPLDITDLITKREIQQVIPIVPGKLSYVLRTFSESEHIWILKHLYNFPGSERYVNELYDMFKVTLSFMGMNNAMVPDHRKNPGKREEEVDKGLFEAKFKIVSGFPTQLVADLGVQCNWFNDRVNSLFSVKQIKNG